MNYFNLGETIAVLGIIIAVYGVIKPRWRLNFYFNRRIFYSVVGLVVLGLLSSLAAFILAAYTNLSTYSSSLQGLTFVFFVCSAIIFLRGAFWTKPLYINKNKQKVKSRFIQRILDESLFFNSEESLNAIITIVRNSLDEICIDITAHSTVGGTKENAAAYFLETLLGESKIVNHIAEKRIDFIYSLVSATEKNRVSGYDINNGISSLMTALYVNPNSYLYQQIGYKGLTNYASIYEVVFGNEYFVREHSPISSWYEVEQKVNFRDQLINENYPKVFIKGFTLALEKFAYEKPGLHQALARGMYQLADYADDVSMELNKLPEYDYFAQPSRAFSEVTRFVGHDFYYDILKKKADNGKVADDELKPAFDSKQYTEGLSAAFCRLFTEVVEAIETADLKTDMERFEILRLNEVFVQSIGSYAHVDGMRNWILHTLWAKSEENITLGHYPVVFRALAIMLYWELPNMPAWAKTERNKLIDTLRNKVRPRILKKELMADDKTPKIKALLPASITFDKKTKKFYTVDGRGNKKILKKQA